MFPACFLQKINPDSHKYAYWKTNLLYIIIHHNQKKKKNQPSNLKLIVIGKSIFVVKSSVYPFFHAGLCVIFPHTRRVSLQKRGKNLMFRIYKIFFVIQDFLSLCISLVSVMSDGLRYLHILIYWQKSRFMPVFPLVFTPPPLFPPPFFSIPSTLLYIYFVRFPPHTHACKKNKKLSHT